MHIKPETEPITGGVGDPRAAGRSPAVRKSAEQLAGSELRDLDSVLNQVSGMIGNLLERLRESEEVLRDAGLKTVQSTSNKLEEVTTATETAATEILDNLDRSLVIVDKMEEGGSNPEHCNELRDELLAAINQLQFQDIAAQQISHAMSLLADLESQLEEFAQVFDNAQAGQGRTVRAMRAFDPNATFDAAEGRQALVDELLAK